MTKFYLQVSEGSWKYQSTMLILYQVAILRASNKINGKGAADNHDLTLRLSDVRGKVKSCKTEFDPDNQARNHMLFERSLML